MPVGLRADLEHRLHRRALGMPHAPPFDVPDDALRALGALLRRLDRRCARAAWPRGRAQWLHLAVTGVLMQAGYLGGVWAAVKAGIGAGTVALLVGLQPVLTALWLTRRVAAAARPRVGAAVARPGARLRRPGAGRLAEARHRRGRRRRTSRWRSVALLSITAGTLYQKRFVAPCDVRTASAGAAARGLVVTCRSRCSRPSRWTGTPTWSARWPGRCSP